MLTALKTLSTTFPLKCLVFLLISTTFQKRSESKNLQLPAFGTKKNTVLVTQVQCKELDRSYVIVTKCDLKAINRTHKFFISRSVLQKDYLEKFFIHFRVLKRSTGGFKPFGIDVIVDVCKYMEGRKNIAFDWFYKLIAPYTNLNHTCPYYAGFEAIYEIPVLSWEFPSVFPEGDYRFDFEFGINGSTKVAAYADLTLKEI